MISSGGPNPGAVRAVRVVSGTLAALTVTLVAAQTAVGFARHQTTEDLVLDPSVTRVVVTGATGDVRGRRAGTGERARITQRATWAFWQPTLTRRIVDGVAYVQAECPPLILGASCAVDVALVLAPGTSLQAECGTGDIALTGLDGQVVVRTSTGDLTLDEMSALRIQARSSTGDVRVTTIADNTVVDAQTSVGDVRVTATAPVSSVRATTSTGDVAVEVPTGRERYAVDADTDTGERRVEVPVDATSGRAITAHSSVGDVRVGGS